MEQTQSSRRRFLSGSISCLGAACLTTRWPAIAEAYSYAQRAAQIGPPVFQFFDAQEAIEVESIAALIIPTDDTPGAREAHVIYFVDRVLATFERGKQEVYRRGLVQLRRKSRQLFANTNTISELTLAQKSQLLTAIENTAFFETVREHTVMGFFANPEYGGNHDQIGWKLIGFEDAGTYDPPFGYYDREANQNKR